MAAYRDGGDTFSDIYNFHMVMPMGTDLVALVHGSLHTDIERTIDIRLAALVFILLEIGCQG
ncbi:hypothetical protein D3C86_2149670 [compost metagenome]